MSAPAHRVLKVMIVDDSKLSRRVIVSEVEKLDEVEISVHENPLDALNVIETFEPDIIVSDYYMYEMTGLEFCRKIRSNSKFKKTPFLIISGSLGVEFDAKVLDVGVNKAISKGFKSNELKKIVERYAREIIGGGDMAILVVDDSRFNRKLMVHMVEGLNARVFQADCAAEGEKMLETHPIDLILLDHMMPGMKGVEWCAQLKKDPKYKDLSIISVSATKDVSLEFLEAGADDFIHKPYSKDEVVVKVKTQFRKINLEKQLKASIQKEQALNHQKNVLLGTAAHDLRNPVATIISYLSLVKDKKYNDEFTEMAIECSYRQAEKALALLNDILDVSSISTGTLSLNLKAMNLEHLLVERVKEMGGLGKKKNIEIRFDNQCAQGDLALIQGDSRRLEQVIDNLLSNAIKYSHENTCTTVKLSRCDEGWLVQVKDQGQGIPEDECEGVFNEFKKTSTKTTGGESSTGLGLAIVKKIVDAHNGFIWVESKAGVGSDFSFTLPVKD